jgi:hypothetical protein
MWQTESDYADSVLDLAQRGEPCATESVPSSASLPERALLRAVLQESILDVRGYATGMSQKNRRHAAQQAYYWMLSRDVTWPFSFENICNLLGFDADCLRRWLLRDAAVFAPAQQVSAVPLIRGGGMVRAVRAARMRGNQQKKPLRLRRRGASPTERLRAAAAM